MMCINDDGTVTIPSDVEVYDVDGILAFRTDRLLGWANLNPRSLIVYSGGRRPIREAVIEELSQQNRGLLKIVPR